MTDDTARFVVSGATMAELHDRAHAVAWAFADGRAYYLVSLTAESRVMRGGSIISVSWDADVSTLVRRPEPPSL